MKNKLIRGRIYRIRLKFETRLKYDWFRLKLYSIFQYLAGAHLKPVFGRFETRLKFIKFGLRYDKISLSRAKIRFELVVRVNGKVFNSSDFQEIELRTRKWMEGFRANQHRSYFLVTKYIKETDCILSCHKIY